MKSIVFSKSQKSRIYDLLYNIAEHWLLYYIPCKWKDGKCKVNRHPNGFWKEQGCCFQGRCRNLIKGKGCRVKALGCKFYLCGEISDDKKYDHLRGIMDALRKVALDLDLYVTCGKGKREIFKIRR